MSDEKKLRDVHSIAKLRSDLAPFKAVAKVRGLIRLLGEPGRRVAEALDNVSEIEAKVDRLSSLPDRFNDAFADRGWIAYELLNVSLMEQAVEFADRGEWNEAEELLADHYTADHVAMQMKFMRCLREFEARFALAEKALVDYAEGRYHACVPVVLMIIDGFVDNTGKSNRGFFAEDVDLTAWDSISAHGSGLAKLTKIFGTKRAKTNQTPITVPYRNGILHGHDAAYDTKLVAAKCWAALFALRDWGLAKRDRRGPVEEKPRSWVELGRSLLRTQERRQALENWEWHAREPAELQRLVEADWNTYDPARPEFAAASFLDAWCRGNFGAMAELMQRSPDEKARALAGSLRRDCDGRKPATFRIVEIRDEAPVVCLVEAELDFEDTESESAERRTIRLTFEDANGEVAFPGLDAGSWVIVNRGIVW